ncbi:MAG TPA: DUF1987 domain-containing protein [Candidatus Cloacimonadota bacterium]|jgi:hypothetical protein|nr:DUF1987 domain-containing protein [Candidatus Cloacimonadota bacterium]HOD54656.1 DUF1987 domain-containing protein [Candidatus Cloacimonadota bacterium]HPM00980.1 DUF1987 domain-containing protein [Candidatus Cloacimonadota bacterium]
MESLHIDESKFTMAVDFNTEKGLCIMSGNSYPEDAISFFEPLNRWLSQYICEVNKPLTVEIKLNYLNSSSSKCFMDIFDLLDDYHQDGGNVHVKWFYQEDDDEIKEAGEELLEDMSFNFEYVEI